MSCVGRNEVMILKLHQRQEEKDYNLILFIYSFSKENFRYADTFILNVDTFMPSAGTLSK